MRTSIISTKQLKLYQLVSLIFWLVLLSFLLWHLISSYLYENSGFMHYYWVLYWGFGFYALFIRRTMRFRSIGFDDKNVYLLEKGHEVIIPFYEIKDIKLKSVMGTHSIELYEDMGFGKEIWFKSSLWYPFNFKRVDDQVYVLQRQIDQAKANYREQNFRALGS